MLVFERHRVFSIGCRGTEVTGHPRHTAVFIQEHLCLLKWLSAAAIILWTVTLIAHLNYALADFYPAAAALGSAPGRIAPILAAGPILLGIGSASYILVSARGRLPIFRAQRHALLGTAGLLACEGLQVGLTHGLAQHFPSYTLANLLFFTLAPLRTVQQVGLAGFSLALPVVVAVATGYSAAETLHLLALMSLPLGAVVLGLIAFYWQYGTFRIRRLAELRLARRTMEVERQKRELERRREIEQVRIQWLEQMARFLRHELRNALVGATTSLTLLQRRSGIPEDDKYMARTQQALRVIGALLESVSEATDIESTLMKETRAAVRLRPLVQEHIEVCRSIYPGKVFTFETDGEDLVTRGKAERFIEMLDNLVSNAVDHAEAGTSIVVSCHRIDGRAVLRVINQGAPLANGQAIFGRFTSFREQARRKGHLGLGLYMVKLIAERYGGHVEARNRTDTRGAEFKVELPTIS